MMSDVTRVRRGEEDGREEDGREVATDEDGDGWTRTKSGVATDEDGRGHQR